MPSPAPRDPCPDRPDTVWRCALRRVPRLLLAVVLCGLPQPAGAADDPQATRNTLLHIAARSGDAEVVSMLLEQGADPNAPDVGRFTPLHRAAENGHAEVISLLLVVAMTGAVLLAKRRL